jgi:diguanylate cyclase (GGDEF)-like protein
MEYSLHLLPFIVSALVVAGMLVVVLFRWREPPAPWFAGTLACLLVWTVAYVVELSVVSLDDKLLWADVQFFAILPQPVFWLLTVRAIVGAPRLPRWMVAGLWLACATLITIVVTDPKDLFRGAPSLAWAGPLHVLDPDYGPAYFALVVPFQFALLSAALVVLVRSARQTHEVFRRRAFILIVATLLPMVVGAMYAADLLPWTNYNPVTAVVTVSAVLCGWAYWQYRLFDLTPLARAAVIEHLADAVLVLDVRGRLVDFNPAAAQVVPGLAGEALGRPVEEVFAFAPGVLACLRHLASGGWETQLAPAVDSTTDDDGGESARVVVVPAARARNGDPAGGSGHYSLTLTPVLSRGGRRRGSALLLHDVTRTVKLLSEVRRLANTDELTDLLSRRGFFALAERELERARRHALPLTVVLLDLDNLKMVNDVYGHAAGDELLRAVATVCREQLRSFDVMGRLGGDEFCAALPDDGPGEAAMVAERLRAAVAGLRVSVGGSLLQTTISIGLAGASVVTDETVVGMLEAADAALYEAKRAGRDRVVARGRR